MSSQTIKKNLLQKLFRGTGGINWVGMVVKKIGGRS